IAGAIPDTDRRTICCGSIASLLVESKSDDALLERDDRGVRERDLAVRSDPERLEGQGDADESGRHGRGVTPHSRAVEGSEEHRYERGAAVDFGADEERLPARIAGECVEREQRPRGAERR